jgi:hypothetical protein
LTDDGLIKTSIHKLEQARILNKINNTEETESSYTKLCSTCLEEEDEIIEKMTECHLIKYLNDVITNEAERVLGTQISNKETKRKPSYQIRLFLFLYVPPLAHK